MLHFNDFNLNLRLALFITLSPHASVDFMFMLTLRIKISVQSGQARFCIYLLLLQAKWMYNFSFYSPFCTISVISNRWTFQKDGLDIMFRGQKRFCIDRIQMQASSSTRPSFNPLGHQGFCFFKNPRLLRSKWNSFDVQAVSLLV